MVVATTGPIPASNIASFPCILDLETGMAWLGVCARGGTSIVFLQENIYIRCCVQ